jgi:cytochrome c peroxidase
LVTSGAFPAALVSSLFLLAAVNGWAEAAAAAPHAHEKPIVLAPGYAELTFEAPVPGTYQLPPLGRAADGAVIDSEGRETRLHDLVGGKIVVLSFIYTTCTDVNGCPLATHVFSKVADRIARSRHLVDQVRLVSLSFDPDHDTAEVMNGYRDRYRRSGVDWRFVTTASIADLEPILDAYDQWVVRDYDEAGNPLGTMSHVLRVYLIDAERGIRNIYSVSYLHADTIASDIETLLIEAEE